MKMTQKIFTLFSLISMLLSSCEIGNFSDIGRYNDNNPLYVYAGGSSDIIAFKLDPENGSLAKIDQKTLAGNVGSIIIDKANNRLFAASGDRISGFHINEDGKLSDLAGYPVFPVAANDIKEIIFAHSNSFLFAVYEVTSDLYGFSYSQAAGTLSPLIAGYPANLGTNVTTARSINANGFMFYSNLTNSWHRTDINPDGSYNSTTQMLNYQSSQVSAAAHDKICIFDPAVATPPFMEIYVYDFGIDSGEINIVRKFVNIPQGGSQFTSFNNPKGMLYFSHNAEPSIYCLKIHPDGNVDGMIKNFQTSTITDYQAMDTDPFGEFLLFSSGTAPYSYINAMKINNDGYPDSGLYKSQSSPQTITELKCFRFEK
ncbi:MAG: hypothetical protein RBT69_05610 [Spirochaetia bacterium]|jgi:6-phosphogluconolactonase (cycloisomerase 2 family)|nr:hypothetical protein [Spirochaetia bacterium]